MATRDEIRKGIETIHPPGEVFEVRALAPRGPKAIGYYDSADLAVEDAELLDADEDVFGVYMTLNPLKPAVLARAENRSKRNATASSDRDVELRRWLFVDFDPVRPVDTSSSEQELLLAKERASVVVDELSAKGWSEPVVAASGNGMHLLYPIDLPNTDAAKSLVGSTLNALAFHYTDDLVKIDTSVYNAARIIRLYGTVARKGDDCANRPHRRSAIISVPS
ncbi:MAG TPA: hypothetical protein VGI19_17750 [Candidatus Cybelea sp.]|jgi:hypothetical protein